MSTPSRTEGAATDRRPGQWPALAHRPGHDDQLWLQLQAQRARRELILGSIAADLQEQPSAHAVRSAGRRWCRYITAMADDIATGADEGVSHR